MSDSFDLVERDRKENNTQSAEFTRWIYIDTKFAAIWAAHRSRRMSLRLSRQFLIGRSPLHKIAISPGSWTRYNSSTTQLPSDLEESRSKLSKSITSRADRLQTSLLFAGQRLNDLTGYSGIEKLKNQIETQEHIVSRTIERVKEARRSYEDAIRTRSESQREVNELLQRKSSWSSSDLERFTTLFRDDHSNSQNEERCQRDLAQSEIEVDHARTTLGNMILARYHEEQIWSDKIRRASTWGTWGLMGFNIFLFILVQLGLEPWKRRRLVGSFEEKVRQVVQQEREASLNDKSTQNGMLAVLQDDNVHDAAAESSYMTDADHSAASVQNTLMDAKDRTVEPVVQLPDSDPISETNAVLPETFEDAKNDTMTHVKPVSRTSLAAGPRSGTSSLLSIPLSLHSIRTYGSVVYVNTRQLGSRVGRQVKLMLQSALSADRTMLRAEDVTSACFASGLLGIAIGIWTRS